MVIFVIRFAIVFLQKTKKKERIDQKATHQRSNNTATMKTTMDDTDNDYDKKTDEDDGFE